MRILIVDDEREMADGLAVILQKEHYLADTVYDGISGLDFIRSNIYDLVLLDLLLPRMSGLDVLKRVRQDGNEVPIILLTAKSAIDDKVVGLDLGADDYMVKPFDTEELLARIRARMRKKTTDVGDKLFCKDLTLHRGTQSISSKWNQIQLSAKEYQLMEHLMINADIIQSKELLIGKVWGPLEETAYNNVEVYISYLRKKLRFLESDQEIRTVKGTGYVLKVKSDE